MIAVFKRFFQDRYVSLIIYIVAAIVFLWIYIALYPYIKSQSEQLNQLMNTYPDSMKKAFGMEAGSLFSTFEGYISTEMFSFFLADVGFLFSYCHRRFNR